MKTIFKTIILASFVSNLALADCLTQLKNSNENLSPSEPAFVVEGIDLLAGVSGSISAIAIHPAMLFAPAVSTTGFEATASTTNGKRSFTDQETYAYKVILQANENNVAPELASFIRHIQREVGVDPRAVIPGQEDIIEVLIALNYDLSICTNKETGKFFRPTKDDLTQMIIEQVER